MVWTKGQSGNPGGRKAKNLALTEELRALLNRKSPNGTVFKDEIATQLVTLAIGGDLDAIKYIYDRVDGKPVQAMEHTDGDGQALVFTLRLANDDSNATD